METKIVCISDTHTYHRLIDIPEGDILVCTGDVSWTGTEEEMDDFVSWFKEQPHEHKIFVAGNHDRMCQRAPDAFEDYVAGEFSWLHDSGVDCMGLHFYGSSWQPEFGYDWAYNLPRGKELLEVWRNVPSYTDVFLTHTPPFGVLDIVDREHIHVGCEEMKIALNRIRPKLHVFGHIHESYGAIQLDSTVYVNASNVDVRCNPVNSPMVVTIENGEVVDCTNE